MDSLGAKAKFWLRPRSKRVLERLLHYVPDVSLATLIGLPWPVKKTLAQIDMATRSLSDIEIRSSFLPDARYLQKYRTPECQHFGPVWQYWHSGVTECPPIIRECMASVKRHTTGREVIILSDNTFHDHVTLPAHILAKRQQMGTTHFSDILRSYLLAQHGGTWIDASVMLTGAIDEVTSSIPFFVFKRPNDPYMLSSWFIHSIAGHPLVCAMRDVLTAYWVMQDELRAYFTFHFFFEAIITLHADLREHWKKMPTMSAMPPHFLQNALLAGSNFEQLQEICRSMPVHKLSYKFPESVRAEAERIAMWASMYRKTDLVGERETKRR